MATGGLWILTISACDTSRTSARLALDPADVHRGRHRAGPRGRSRTSACLWSAITPTGSSTPTCSPTTTASTISITRFTTPRSRRRARRSSSYQLSASGLASVGVRHRMIENTLPWEGLVTEAPFVIRRGGYYYMFYSGAAYNTDRYGIGSRAPGTRSARFRKRSAPILRSNAVWSWLQLVRARRRPCVARVRRVARDCLSGTGSSCSIAWAGGGGLNVRMHAAARPTGRPEPPRSRAPRPAAAASRIPRAAARVDWVDSSPP